MRTARSQRLEVSWDTRKGSGRVKNTAVLSRPGVDGSGSDGSGKCGAPECTGMGGHGARDNLRKSRVLVSYSEIEWSQGRVEGCGPGGLSPSMQ